MPKTLTFAIAFLLTAPAVAETDPAALWRSIESTRLAPDQAVVVENLKLDAGLARLEIEAGTFFPATPVGGRVAEMVFLGEARLVLEPPDDIEAGQMELFTGSSRLDEPISEAVLVIAVDAAVDVVFRRPAVDAGADAEARAQELFDRWRERPERRLLGVDTAILRDAVGDPVYAGYFAGWFEGEELGEFIYFFEPDSYEQVTLGQFTLIDATEKEKRQITRQLHRAQRKGRFIGRSVEDLGQWDTWLASSLRDAENKTLPGSSYFEPELYEIDLSLEGPKLELRSKARLHLRTFERSNVLMLRIASDLTIDQVRLGGRELYARQAAGEVLVVLPETPAPGSTFVLEVDSSGHLIDKDGKTYVLRDTIQWYPHAGSVDLATYDVTFRWPEKLALVSGGQRVDGGSDGPGRRFERRRLDKPTFGFSFEVGHFKTLTGQAGHVEVALSFDARAQNLIPKEGREEILETILDSLAYFEEAFGPYPFDELHAVTAPRMFSQSLLGFVTLATLNMIDIDIFSLLLGLEDRRTVVAHEIAHQWWGHMVPWKSYRDQWISEAMANYSAVLYSRHRLRDGEPVLIGPTSGWQSALISATVDGRPVESLGPLVLGERLISSAGGAGVYHAIVYKKGAVVLDMLAQRFREDIFLKVLRSLVRAVSFRPISTEDFVSLIERITEIELDGFARQFIYGTGLPEIYYDYQFEPAPSGKWRVKGEARIESPWHFQYRVLRRDDGAYDVERERLDQIEARSSSMVVPFQIAIYDPEKKLTKAQKKAKLNSQVTGNAMIRGRLLLDGETTPIELELDYEPKELWLDGNKEAFGRFFNERRRPKRMLYYQGIDIAAAGDHARAEEKFHQALEAETFSGPAYSDADRESHKAEGRLLDCQIHLRLARLYLDAGKTGEARTAYGEARKLTTNASRYGMRDRLKRLEARLAIRERDYERAYRLLRKAHRGGTGSTEGLLLFAIAARETGHVDEFETATKAAEEKGADMAALSL